MNDSYKGFFGIMKGIVTRTDDPEAEKNNGRKRIQVCIPAYHIENKDTTIEDVIKDTEKTGKPDTPELGKLPWAQVCSNMFNGNSAASAITKPITTLVSIIFGISNNSIEMLYPSVGDVVWLMFEGGDIRCPVYVGSMSADVSKQVNVGSILNNIGGSNTYTPNGNSLSALAVDMIKTINKKDYDSLFLGSSQTFFGIMGWKGLDAKVLFMDIRDSGKASFEDVLKNNHAEAFLKDLEESKNWSTYRVQKGSNLAKALKELLRSANGKGLQDRQSLFDASTIISRARAKGLNDEAAILFYVHTYMNGYEKIADSVVTKCEDNLDSIYNLTMKAFSSYSKTTKSFRSQAHSWINNLIMSGKIIASSGSSTGDNRPSTGSSGKKKPDITGTGKPPRNSGSSGHTSGHGMASYGKISRPVNYKQFDSRWGRLPFGPGTSSNRTYGAAACSVTCVADIVATWTDSSVTPVTVGNKAVDWKFRTATSNGVGNAGAFYKKCASYWGIKRFEGNKSFDYAYNKIKSSNGNALAILGINGKWTSGGGHFVVMYKVDGDTIYINDPGINSNSSKGRAREKASKSEVKYAVTKAHIFYRS